MTTLQLPSNPAVGDTYTFNEKTWAYDGVKWSLMVSSRPVTVNTDVNASATAPENPVNGTLWLDTSTGDFFVYYNGNWQEAGGGGGAGYDSVPESTGFFGLPIGNNTQRPATPVDGAFRVNSETENLEVYYANNWIVVKALKNLMSATGGSIATLGTYKYHTFTTAGALEITAGIDATLEYLVVGGGGGGGAGPYQGGGGGGGGFVAGNVTVNAGETYTIEIGGGGTTSGGPGAGANGSNGQDSMFYNFSTPNSIIAKGLGGGGGGGESSGATAQPGGSGGGSTHGSAVITGAAATQPSSEWGGFGNSGGAGHSSTNNYLGGGGGGAGFPGGDATSAVPGDGGDGMIWPFGSGNYYAGGGGGKRRSGALGLGGAGGGGGSASGPGAANTGGGGAWGNLGGSGVVIFRYTTV